MKQAELAHYRAMLLAQAAEPRRGLFAARAKMAFVAVADHRRAVPTPLGPPLRRAESLFGRRPPEAAAPPALPRVIDAATWRLAETPYHAEDLADPPSPNGPAPGVIAGWSSLKPPGAQVRLLRRLGAVIEAERQGLAARLAAAEVGAA